MPADRCQIKAVGITPDNSSDWITLSSRQPFLRFLIVDLVVAIELAVQNIWNPSGDTNVWQNSVWDMLLWNSTNK